MDTKVYSHKFSSYLVRKDSSNFGYYIGKGVKTTTKHIGCCAAYFSNDVSSTRGFP